MNQQQQQQQQLDPLERQLNRLPLELSTQVLREIIQDDSREVYGTLHAILRSETLQNAFLHLFPQERANLAGTRVVRLRRWLTSIRRDPAYLAAEARFQRIVTNWQLTFVHQHMRDCLDIAIWFTIPGNLHLAHLELLHDIQTEYYNDLRAWENRLYNVCFGGLHGQRFPPALGRAMELGLADRWITAVDRAWGNAVALSRRQAIDYLWNEDRANFAMHGHYSVGINRTKSVLSLQYISSVWMLLTQEMNNPDRYVTLSNMNPRLEQHVLLQRITHARTVYLQYWDNWWTTGQWIGPSISAAGVQSYLELPGPGPIDKFPVA